MKICFLMKVLGNSNWRGSILSQNVEYEDVENYPVLSILYTELEKPQMALRLSLPNRTQLILRIDHGGEWFENGKNESLLIISNFA